MQQLVNLQALLGWIGIGDTAERTFKKAVLAALGEPKLMRQVVAIPLAIYDRALKDLQVAHKEGEDMVERGMTPVEQGQVGELRRVARIVLGLAPEVTLMAPRATAVAPAGVTGAAVSGGGAAATTPPVGPGGTAQGSGGVVQSTQSEVALLTQAIKDAVKPTSKRICACKVLDQAGDTEIAPLDPKDLSGLVDDWRTLENDGEEPTEEEEATADQMASLEARARSGATPYADFGVWRPHGQRMERALKFVVHHLQTDGTTKPSEINGPDSYSQWIKSWRVYAFAMVALKLATRTRLQRYADRIRLLTEEWPQFWWVIMLADIKMRSEGLERVRRLCIRRKSNGLLPDYDELRPWDVTYREAAADTDFWGREVDKQIVMYVTSLKSASRICDTGIGPIVETKHGGSRGKNMRSAPSESSGESSSVKKKKRGSAAKERKVKKVRGGKGKKAPKQAAQAGAPAKGGGNAKPAALIVDPSRASEKKADGSWTRDESGRQICWAFGRGTCKRHCPTNRAHACEKCRGTDHGAKECIQAK